MAKYRKKPVVIEAVQWTGDNFKKIQEMLKEADEKRVIMPHPNEDKEVQSLLIVTLEGEMRADKGDYIIKGVKGEIYPCKPDIFEKTYEPVEEDDE
jgi:hypothetical protein